MIFPYRPEKTDNFFVYKPKIPIVLRNAGNEMEVFALIDSGADISIVQKNVAEFLGLDLGGKNSNVRDFHGKDVEVSTAFVNVEIRKGDEKIRIPNMEVKVPMKEDEQIRSTILGRYNFFTEFDITFRENAKRIELAKVRH